MISIARACIVPAALILTASVAQAQSTVNISGTVDIGVYRGFDKRTQVGPISRSNVAFSGSEDLGNGLATIFKLSMRFDPDTGTVEDGIKPLFHGESTVGLKSALDTIRLGRAMDAVNANDWAFDPWGNFDRIASPAWQFWHYNYTADRTSNGGRPEYQRLSNGIFYDSPSLAGFSVSVSGSPEKSGTTTGNQESSRQGALKYAQGPVTAMVAHGKNGNGDKVLFAGGKVAFGNFAVMGAYDRSEFNATPLSVAYARTLGATYQWGNVLLQAGYGRLKVGETKNKFIGMGSQYALSKRTYVYVDYGNLRPNDAPDTRAYGVGVNHSF
jgi:predicted porin